MNDFFGNYILMCAVIASLLAQVIKFFLTLFLHREVKLERFFGTGGMPSSHSAMVCALTVAAAQTEGTRSTTFALCFVLACIVIYDAMNIRRAAGEQAKIINEMQHEKDEEFKELKEMLGHTPIEVLGGILVGILVPIIGYYLV